MALVYRNGRPYLYRSIRQRGRVTSQYLAGGEDAFRIDALPYGTYYVDIGFRCVRGL